VTPVPQIGALIFAPIKARGSVATSPYWGLLGRRQNLALVIQKMAAAPVHPKTKRGLWRAKSRPGPAPNRRLGLPP
jgi:hypothetical protein